MKKIILLLSLVVCGLKGIAQEWIHVGATNEDDKIFIKANYVSKSIYGNEIKIWVRTDYKRLTIEKAGKNLTYINARKLTLVRVNCLDKTMKFVSIITYNSQGKVVDSFTFEEYESDWHDVVPGSIGELQLESICERFSE